MGNTNFLPENEGEYVCLNGEIIEAQRYLDIIDDDYYWTGGVAYEVISVVRGAPMFLDEHCARLNASLAEINKWDEIGGDFIFKPLSALLRANGGENCSVKVWAAFDKSADINIFMNIVGVARPPPEYYAEGAPVGLYAYTREYPNAQRFVPGFLERVRALTESGCVYELLLYDESNRLTEGSQSNLFFSRGGRLYTAPDRHVLKGITRKHIFAAAERAGVEIVERPVALEEIGLSPGSLDRRRSHDCTASGRSRREGAVKKIAPRKKAAAFPTPGPWPGTEAAPVLPVLTVNGAFLTGMSIGVLPIARIGGVAFDSAGDPLIKRIRAEYDKIIKNYVDPRR